MAAIVHQLRKIRGLPTRSRTSIEHLLARLRVKEIAGDKRARVLHVTETAAKPRDRQPRCSNRARMEVDLLRPGNRSRKLPGGDLQPIGTNVNFGWPVVRLAQGNSRFPSKLFLPAANEKIRM